MARDKWDDLNNKLSICENNLEQIEIKKLMYKEHNKCIRITQEDIKSIQYLMRLYGTPYITAEGEADVICSILVKKKYAYGCMSEDMDLFVYGTSRVYRYLSLLNNTVVYYDLKIILKELKISIEEFKQICILSGTDYYQEEDNYRKLNIYDTLYLFYKYKKTFIKNMDFATWVLNTSDKHKEYKYNDINNLFDTNNTQVNLKRNDFKLTTINKVELHDFMKLHGFIYVYENT